jgi:hypothetical protein
MSRDSSKVSAWSDADLTNAVLASRSWRGVMRELGLCVTSSGSLRVVKRRVAVLGLDTSHFTGQRTWSDAALKRAAAHAHSWNELLNAIGIKRVQVKTTTYNSKNGWMIQVGRRPYSIGNNARLVPYDPDSIDLFFIVDGDLSLYLIPSRVIAGRVGLLLRTYSKYIVGSAAGLMATRTAVA